MKIQAVPCEVFSRIVGYYRPVRNWNDGKREEFHERKMIDLKPMIHDINEAERRSK